MDFQALNAEIKPLSEPAMARARERWDSIAKPLHGLGLLEDHIVQIAGLTGDAEVRLDRRTVLVLCADNGVVAQGVTQTGASVTAAVAEQLARGRSSVCRMAAAAGAEVLPVDLGMLRRVPGVLDRHVADGTGDISRGPAMTREQAEQTVRIGIELVKEQKEAGSRLLAAGEMGIGNTTTAAAAACVLLGLDPDAAAGRGAGLSDAGLARKRAVIRRAIELNRPDPGDALDVLAKVGGFDLAGMAGVFLGGALYRIPVILDGFISCVSALLAVRLCPGAKRALLASHASAEPAARAVLEALGLEAALHARLKLGEGTGAVCLIPLLDLALALYGGSSFAQAGIEPYRPQGGEA